MSAPFERTRADGTRWCSKCKTFIDQGKFRKDASRRDGLSYWCNDCVSSRRKTWERDNAARNKEVRRAKHLKVTFGLDEQDVTDLLVAQGGVCAICRTDEPGDWGTWHIDHDRSCCPGKDSCGRCIRGLLCNGCNRGLGQFRDDPESLRRAADYVSVERPVRLVVVR